MKVMPDNYIRLMFSLLRSTGLRINELLPLKVKDVIIEGKLGKIYVASSKGDKPREVPIIYNEVT